MIDRELVDGVAVLRMRHGKVNALDLELCEALSRAFEEIRAGPARAIVLTGSGRVFSAGVDLRRFLAGGAAYATRFHPELCGLLERVFLFPRPVIAAVNGHAIAGGCLLAAACDFRFLAQGEWKIGTPELRIGLPIPAAGLEALRMVVPAVQLRDVTLRGRSFTGEAALRAGLADELVDAEQLDHRAIAEASRLGALGDVFQITKEQLRGRTRQFLVAHGHRLDQQGLQMWRRPSTFEAVRRYTEATLKV